jgi:hypothetical protein
LWKCRTNKRVFLFFHLYSGWDLNFFKKKWKSSIFHLKDISFFTISFVFLWFWILAFTKCFSISKIYVKKEQFQKLFLIICYCLRKQIKMALLFRLLTVIFTVASFCELDITSWNATAEENLSFVCSTTKTKTHKLEEICGFEKKIFQRKRCYRKYV